MARSSWHALERFVAINSALEIDLTGQMNGEVAGGSYLARSAAHPTSSAPQQSPDGVSLMLLPSARIVDRLSGPVATSRSEAGIIVTSAAPPTCAGCSLRERERRLRAIS